MKLLEIKKAANNGHLPVALNTCYKWSTLNKFPNLIIKVANKLFWDSDEWINMAKQAKENQVRKAKRINNKEV